ncbi:MAG: arsenate reductase ArsC [Algiphilus sp.]
MRNVLILCTGNSARSIMAEAMFNHLDGERVRAYSAGSHPKTAPHPMALQCLAEAGIDTSGLHSKSWDIFTEAHAPQLNLVLTVCDAAAGEACPLFPGNEQRTHWGLPDPPAAASDEARWARFRVVRDALRARIDALLALPDADWDGEDFAQRVADLHQRLPQPLAD